MIINNEYFYNNYQRVFDNQLNANTNTIINISYRHRHAIDDSDKNSPFSAKFMDLLEETIVNSLPLVFNFKLAFIGYKNITILCDNTKKTHFENNVQNLCTLYSTRVSTAFNKLYAKSLISMDELQNLDLIEFKTEVFQINKRSDIYNYFMYVQADYYRYSIFRVADYHLTQEQIKYKNLNEVKSMLLELDVDWDSLEWRFKYGRLGVIENGIISIMDCPIIKDDHEKADELIKNALNLQ